MLVLALFVAMTATMLYIATSAQADDITVSSDVQRTGWDPNEPSLSPGAVTGSDFGELFSSQITGQVYAQPLVVGTTVIVGTEENHVYGINSETGAIIWQVYLGPSWPASTIGCGDLVPDIGITSTPVYDPSSGYVYLTAKVNDGGSATTPHYYLYAISAANGAIRTGWPVTIGGSASNDSSATFSAERQMQRTGLLLQNGSVYVGFGSHCDYGPYRGYVDGVNVSTKSQHLWTSEAGPNGANAGIWQAGGGIVSDGSGGMFIATGNGVTPPVGPGTSPPQNLSESVVHLNVASDGTISANDFFAPSNAATLDANDQDLASGGPVALPEAEFGTAAHPHLMVEIGKDGRLFLLDRTSLGGRSQGSGGGDKILGETQLSGVWGHPAVWGGDGGYVYVDESNSHLVALKYGLTGSGQPSFSVAGTSQQTFAYTSGSPVVTSDGTNSGSALVWIIQSSGSSGGNGQLMVYNAVPSSGVMTLLRSWPIGTVSKFSVAASNNGRVYVGTRDGHLLAFGAPTTQTLQGAGVNFGDVAVNSTGTGTATLTATRTVTVNSVSVAAPFAAGTSTPALPATLTAGQTLSVPVTFSPTTWGAETAQLSVTTNVGNFAFGLNGTGTQPGLGATPTSLAWGSRAVGSSETLTASVTNTGTTTETFQTVTGPASGPFTASGLPAVGSTLAAGASTTISATYAPTAISSSDTAEIDLTTDQGSLKYQLTGSAIAANPQVTINPMSLSFGNVPVGQTASQTFTVANTGNVNLTVTKAAPPAAPFGSTNPLPEGQQLAPGESYTVTVTFAPTAQQSYTGAYEVSTDTGQGAMYINLTGTGTPPGGQLYDTQRTVNNTWWPAWQQGPANSTGILQTDVTAMPNGDAQAVAVTANGVLEHTINHTANNTWQAWGVPKNDATAVWAGIAGMPDGSSQLIEVTSAGTLEHTIRFGNATWQANWGTPAGSTGIAQAAITAMPNGDSQIVAVTTSGALEFNIRYHTNTWSGWQVLNQPGVKVTNASIAGMRDGSSQLVEVTSTGTLMHTIRFANGTWQANWGVPVGSTGMAEAAITAMPNGDAQLVAVTTSGVLKHDIRFANNTWQTGGWGEPHQPQSVTAATSPSITGLTDGNSELLEVSAG